MSNMQNSVVCSVCHTAIDVSLDTSEIRNPCGKCGGVARIFNETITETLTVRDGIGFKHRRPGNKKPLAEGFSKPDVSRKTGTAVERQMLVDRQNDRYVEVVTEYDTGAVIHRCEEKLSEHKGHGSAKQRDPKHG